MNNPLSSSKLLTCPHCKAFGAVTWQPGENGAKIVAMHGGFHWEDRRTKSRNPVIVCTGCDTIQNVDGLRPSIKLVPVLPGPVQARPFLARHPAACCSVHPAGQAMSVPFFNTIGSGHVWQSQKRSRWPRSGTVMGTSPNKGHPSWCPLLSRSWGLDDIDGFPLVVFVLNFDPYAAAVPAC